jgi:hypothetical protein
LHTGHEAIKKPKWFQRRDGGGAVNQFSAQNSDPMRKDLSETAYDALRIYAQALVEVLSEAASGKQPSSARQPLLKPGSPLQ